MEVKKPKISREILKVSQVPTRKTASYVGEAEDTSRQMESLNASVLRGSPVGSATSSLGIPVHVSVTATLKFVHYFNFKKVLLKIIAELL